MCLWEHFTHSSNIFIKCLCALASLQVCSIWEVTECICMIMSISSSVNYRWAPSGLKQWVHLFLRSEQCQWEIHDCICMVTSMEVAFQAHRPECVIQMWFTWIICWNYLDFLPNCSLNIIYWSQSLCPLRAWVGKRTTRGQACNKDLGKVKETSWLRNDRGAKTEGGIGE